MCSCTHCGCTESSYPCSNNPITHTHCGDIMTLYATLKVLGTPLLTTNVITQYSIHVEKDGGFKNQLLTRLTCMWCPIIWWWGGGPPMECMWGCESMGLGGAENRGAGARGRDEKMEEDWLIPWDGPCLALSLYVWGNVRNIKPFIYIHTL